VSHRASTSEFKGVFWIKSAGKWRAEYKGTYLGYHTTEEAAAQAYDNYVKDGSPQSARNAPPLSSRVSSGTRQGLALLLFSARHKKIHP